MEFQAIATFALMVLLLTVMPGPNTALILKTVPQRGRYAGGVNLAGIVCAFFMHGLFSICGLSALILKTSQAFFAVKLLGSFYLLYLGVTFIWQAIRSKKPIVDTGVNATSKTDIRPNKKVFLEGFLTNILNPKASMFYLAVFPQFISLQGNPVLESFLLVGIHSLIVVVWFSFLINAIDKIAHALSSPRFTRIVQGATGSLMLWFGYRLLTYQQEN